MSGQLPFPLTGVLRRPDNTVAVAELPCDLWSTGDRTTGRGVNYDHAGIAPSKHYAELRRSNARLVVDGVTYTIVAASREPFDVLGHVDLRLTVARAGG